MAHARGGSGSTLTFWGAAGSIGGSLHVLDIAGRTVLLDCGLYQGRRDDARDRNAHFPFRPETVDAVIVSHAHIDHCGNLPTLVRQGFTGPIYCTPPTRDLLKVMLEDSAKIQEEDAAHLNIARQYAEPLVEPLYSRYDVGATLRAIEAVPYDRPFDVGFGVTATLLRAGHILGSAMVHVDSTEGSITFTGDLGRRGLPILKPTAQVPAADVLVCESTYGNRVHASFPETVQQLYAIVRATHERGGKVLIPAFSLGRTQLIVHVLQQGLRTKQIPPLPIFVDSPLAAAVADVYRAHPDQLSDDVARAVEDGHGILGGDGVSYVRSPDESLRLTAKSGPYIVVASSGMCDAGRIQQHLKAAIDDPRASIVLVSYQASGTVGRKLLESGPTVRFGGKDWNKWLEVHHLDGFSGHADQADFEAYLKPIVGKVKHVRLIHGEREQAEGLATRLEAMGFDDVSVPKPGDAVEF
jgi:metallo-beta-lactamase family protein